MARSNRSFDLAFKRKAVMLACEDGVKVKDVAARLGVHPGQLTRWKRDFQDEENRRSVAGRPTGTQRSKADEGSTRQFRRLLEQMRDEQQVLSRATGTFPQPRRRPSGS